MNQKSGSKPSIKIALFVVAAVIVVAAIVLLRIFPPGEHKDGLDVEPVKPVQNIEGPRPELKDRN